MDISEAFHCLPHDILTDQLEKYRPGKESLLLLMSYFKNRKQSVKIKGIRSLFHFIKSEVPKGQSLDQFSSTSSKMIYFICFKLIFTILLINNNTILSVSDTLSVRIKSLTGESGSPIDWFTINSMIVNPDKFKAIIFTKSKQDTSGILISLRGH